jgi:hypothetical protein
MSEVWVSFKLSDYHQHHYKIAISLPELVEATNAFSVKNRPGCTPHLEASDPKDLFLRYNVKCNLETSDPKGHDVKVHFDVSKVTPEMRANDLDIKCTCSCPAFLYWGAQWNLNEKGGLEGEARPKLQAPKERLDLRTNFVICKHCKAVFERILPAVQHNIQNLVREKVVEEYKQTPTKAPTRLDREQEAMRQRQLLKKKRRTPKEKEDLEEMQRKERDRLLQEEAELDEQTEREIERTAPAVEEMPTPAEQKEKLKQPQKEEVHVKDEEQSHSQNHDLLDKMLLEEKRKLEEQAEGDRKRLKKMRDDKFNNWKKNRNRNQNFRVSSLEEEEETEDVTD